MHKEGISRRTEKHKDELTRAHLDFSSVVCMLPLGSIEESGGADYKVSLGLLKAFLTYKFLALFLMI